MALKRGGTVVTLPNFEYLAVKSLKEAVESAAQRAGHCVLMAGGTDVILLLKEQVLKGVDTVIDLKGMPGLDGIEYTEGRGLTVGALAKLYEIHNSPIVREKLPAVADAAHYVASTQIRRKGTMAGNICNASPSADTAPIIIAMKAVIKTASVDGCREIPAGEFFTGVKRTCLDKAKGEMVTAIFIPELGAGEGSAYFKHAVRKAMDLAIIGVAAWVKVGGGIIKDCRIAMGGVGVTPLRAPEAEKLLIGHAMTEELLDEASRAAAAAAHPISDVRASAEYRTDMVRVYTKRAVKKAIESLKA